MQPKAMTDPTDDITSEKAAEILRLTLPMMSRNGVPATPHNYATWYAYVAGENAELTAEVDHLIAEGQKFTAAVNARLYRKFLADHDMDRVEDVRTQLSALMNEVGGRLSDAGNDAHAFTGALNTFSDSVSNANDLHKIQNLLGKLLDETHQMRSSNDSMQSHFEEKTREIELLQEQLQAERERAATDPLTGLFNRITLLERIDEAIDATGAGQGCSVIMFDIDHFKAINDTHGHLIGDRVIRFVAKSLQQNIKGQDTAARFGGEEFTVLLPATPSSGAKAVAETIRKAVEAAQLVRADTKKPIGDITISAGIATYRRGEDTMELLNRADQALYRSKNEGRNRCTLAS